MRAGMFCQNYTFETNSNFGKQNSATPDLGAADKVCTKPRVYGRTTTSDWPARHDAWWPIFCTLSNLPFLCCFPSDMYITRPIIPRLIGALWWFPRFSKHFIHVDFVQNLGDNGVWWHPSASSLHSLSKRIFWESHTPLAQLLVWTIHEIEQKRASSWWQ